MDKDLVVKVDSLTKIYKLYDRPKDRVKETVNPFGRKYHREFYALNDVSFEVKKGETVGIIGKNGSGKSTLLKLITGVLTPTSGGIYVNGKISSLLELGAGFNPELTGMENIYLHGTIMGYTRAEMDERLAAILSFADIGDFVNQPVKMYSSGMFVRLAFSVAINVNPDVLIVDEALAVGDSQFQRKCFRKFEEFRNSGKTILFVTHDVLSVKQYCNTAYLLENGKIIDEGEPNKVVNNYYRIVYSDGTSSDVSKTTRSEYRFGNGFGEVVKVDLLNSRNEVVDSIGSCEECTIRVVARAKKDLLKPVIGFTLKTINGIEVFAINTNYEGIDIPAQVSGSKFAVEFRQKMALNSGEFFLSSGLSDYIDSKIVPVDRRLDFKKIIVHPNNASSGIANLNSEITVTVCL